MKKTKPARAQEVLQRRHNRTRVAVVAAIDADNIATTVHADLKARVAAWLL